MYRQLFLWGILLAVLLISSCVTTTPIQEVPIVVQEPQHSETPPPVRPPVSLESGGIIEEIRSLAEIGTPSSLIRALDLIREKDLGGSEFGRVMNAVIVALIQKVYPHIRTQLPVPDPPQNHVYTKILRNIEQRVYISPQHPVQDYLEYVLPFLALIAETKTDRLLSALEDMRRAQALNTGSVLAPYFMGLIYERTNRPAKAKDLYKQVSDLSPECYPAVLGLVRIMNGEDQRVEAIQLLQNLVIQFPDNIALKQELALAYYTNRDWSRAESAIREILQRNNPPVEFILMQAHALVEQGKFFQALPFLERYAGINQNNKLYLFLRARIQAEGYHNQDAALNYLYSLINAPAVDEEILVYTVGLLLESNRQKDQTEGQTLLQRLLSSEKPSLRVIELAFHDAVRREDWKEAQPYLNRLLEERPLAPYLLSAYKVARGLGNTAEALMFAQQFHQQDPANEEGTIAYISALIDAGQIREADRLIESRLATSEGGTTKAQYYYLRSRIRQDQELALKDLRSSLFEDPRNLNALITLFEIYHRQGNKRRAVYYLKQALVFAPDSPQLQKYELEYREEG